MRARARARLADNNDLVARVQRPTPQREIRRWLTPQRDIFCAAGGGRARPPSAGFCAVGGVCFCSRAGPPLRSMYAQPCRTFMGHGGSKVAPGRLVRTSDTTSVCPPSPPLPVLLAGPFDRNFGIGAAVRTGTCYRTAPRWAHQSSDRTSGAGARVCRSSDRTRCRRRRRLSRWARSRPGGSARRRRSSNISAARVRSRVSHRIEFRRLRQGFPVVDRTRRRGRAGGASTC